MERATIFALSLALAGSVCVAQAQQGTAAATTASTRKKAAAKTSQPTVSSQLSEMKQAIESQQQQIQQLSQQVQSRDQRIQQLEQRLDQSQATAMQAQTKADAAAAQAGEQQQNVAALKNDVSDLKSNSTNVALSLQETQTNIRSSLESPLALHYKGITITPGGYLAAETVWRQHALASDINTPFNSVPYAGRVAK